MIEIDFIKRFYTTELGCVFKREINALLAQYLGLKNNSVLCLGYNEFEHKVPTMIPARQGLVSGTISTHEGCLAVGNDSVDCAIVVHLIEYVQSVDSVLQEVRRVLKVGGTAIFIVPNFCSNVVPFPQVFKPGKLLFLFKYKLKSNLLVVHSTHGVLTIGKHIPPVVSVVVAKKASNTLGGIFTPVMSAQA